MDDKITKALANIKETAALAYKHTKKALKYLRINDENNMLSLTNIAMILILFKIATTAATSMEDIGLLLGVLSSYQAKRLIEAKSKSEEG